MARQLLSITKPPGTIVNDASAGTCAWTYPSRAVSSDNSYAGAFNLNVPPAAAQYLKATNFGFDIDESYLILGVVAHIELKKSGDIQGGDFKLVVGGSRDGDSNGVSGSWPTSDVVYDFGGSSDTWSLSLDSSDVNASNFGISLTVTIGGTSVAYIDSITLTVYYYPKILSQIICISDDL